MSVTMPNVGPEQATSYPLVKLATFATSSPGWAQSVIWSTTPSSAPPAFGEFGNEIGDARRRVLRWVLVSGAIRTAHRLPNRRMVSGW